MEALPHLGTLFCLIWLALVAGMLAVRHIAKARMEPLGDKADDAMTILRAAIDHLPDLIYVKDTASRFLLANTGVAKHMGVETGDQLLGKTDFDFYPQELASKFFADERQVLGSGQAMVSREELITCANGESRYLLTTKAPFFDAAGRAIGIVGVGRDITELKKVEAELRRAREELEFKAAHDSLTTLLNRGAILERLDQELDRCRRENSSVAVLLGDLDHFKAINDRYGHPVGDEVLRQAAVRILNTVRTYDLVGRYGGEEFLMVLPGCGPADALARAEQLRETVASPPVPTVQGPIPITMSLGVLSSGGWRLPACADILREVDAALYAAKDAGRNRCVLAGTACTLSAAPVAASR